MFLKRLSYETLTSKIIILDNKSVEVLLISFIAFIKNTGRVKCNTTLEIGN